MAKPTSDNITLKERLRQEILRDIQDFLQRGGTITELQAPRQELRPVITIGLELPLAVDF